MNPAEVKSNYLLSETVRRYVELKPKGNDLWGCCPFHGERTGSFVVQDQRRSWHCFGCGAHGDIVDFVQLMDRCSVTEACNKITGGAGEKIVSYLPPPTNIYKDLVPADAGEADLPQPGQWFDVWNPKANEQHPNGRFSRYKPQLVHPYRETDGKLIGCTVRLVLRDRKIVPMLRMILKDGKRTWAHFPFEEPRPLYGAELIKKNDPAPLVLVEGEKCADVVRRVLGGVGITWAGGTNAQRFTNWRPLNGHKVIIWPDNDPEGIAAMLGKQGSMGWVNGALRYVKYCNAAGKKYVSPDASKPKGWDIADAVEKDGWSRAQIISWMKQRMEIGDKELLNG